MPSIRPPGFATSLDGELPPDVLALLASCDGVRDSHGTTLAWPIAEVLARNREMRSLQSFRELYMPFDHLLFFSDDGGGDLFGLPIDADGEIRRPDIFRWDHETDSRAWFASDAKQYIASRLASPE